MNSRRIWAHTAAFAAAGLSLTVVSPAWADCCDSLWSCAATYVTDGLSCEIETLIDTLNALSTGITNFIHDVDGQTQAALQASIQSVDDSYNQMQSQSQQSDSDLATALSQATALYQQETAIKVQAAQSYAGHQQALTAPVSGTTTPPRPEVEARAGSAQATSGGLPLAMTAQPTGNLATAGVGATLVSNTPGTFADAFSRAIQQIQTLKAAGDTDFARVNSYLQQAKNSENSGVAAANQVQNVMNAPLTAMQSALSDMLTHPWEAADPTSVVDSIEATITADLTANVNKMIGDITTNADTDFNAAQPNYDDLLANAEAAQALETAMANAYQQRTPAAADALYAALPKRQFIGMDSKSTAGTALGANNNATKFGRRVPYSVIAAQMSTVQQHAKLAYKAPNIDQIHLLVARFKAQRAQGKTLPQPTLAAYKSKLAQQLDSQFNGKSSAAILSQRDQLVAQARTQFARDPNTANAVVGLLNSEASRRAGIVGTAATNPASNPTIGGQPVATTTVQRTAVTNSPQIGSSVPVSSINQGPPGSGFGRTTPGATTPGATTPGATTPGVATTWTQPTATTMRPVTGATTIANPTIPGQPVSAVAPQRTVISPINPSVGLAAPTAVQAAPVMAPAGQSRSTVWGAPPPQGWTPPPAAAAATKAPAAAPVQQPSQVQAAQQVAP
jgi:hypothetical protein